MKQRILLVGGALCTQVAMGLDRRQWQVCGLRRNPPASATIDWVRADLGDPATLAHLPEGMTHLLYAPSPDGQDMASYQQAYPQGLKNLLEALPARTALQRLVLVGSTAVWSPAALEQADAWVDEYTPPRPENFRGEAILEAEQLLQDRLPHRGVALRLGGIYGPGRTRLLEALRQGRLVAPTGPGHWSNRIHIEDAASACLHLLNLDAPAACYIGTDGQPTDKAAFYDRLADLTGLPYVGRRAIPPSGKRLSNARLMASGWQPAWPDAIAGYQVMLGNP